MSILEEGSLLCCSFRGLFGKLFLIWSEDLKIEGAINKTDLTWLSYLHTLTCFELRPPWRLLFLQVQDRPHKTSVPPRPDTFQLDTTHTSPDPRRSTSQRCSSLTHRWGKTPREVKGYSFNDLLVERLTHTHRCIPVYAHFNLGLQCFSKELPSLWLFVTSPRANSLKKKHVL